MCVYILIVCIVIFLNSDNMRITLKSLSSTIIVVLMGVLAVSCVNEIVINDDPEPSPPLTGKKVRLAISVPKNSISSYASEIGSADENHIDTLFVRILEDGVIRDSMKYFGTSLQDVIEPNDSIVNVVLEPDNLTGGSITAEAFANRMEVMPVTGEIPLPDKNDRETWFMMSGSAALAFNGTAYSGTIHLVRHVAKLRVRISKHTACIPSNLVINYNQIKVEVINVPDRTQLMIPPPIDTPAGLSYIANYRSGTGMGLRSETPIATFNGGQIDSMYMNENYLNNSDYNDSNITQVKITIPSQEPGMPVKTAEYTYKLFTEGSYRIKRNHIYILDIKIAGQTLEPLVSMEILPWNDVNVKGDIQGVFLNLDRSTVYLSPVDIQNSLEVINFSTDHTSVMLDWSKVNPAHPIDTSVKYIQGMNGQIRFSWTGGGAPDYSFKDTVYVIAGNIIKPVVMEYNVPAGNFGDWVGTFHRWNQTGERIIKMRNLGEWTANVTEGVDFIRLNGGDTKDANWGTSLAALGNNTGFDDNYPVLGGASSLSGNGIIYFRVGLTGTLAHIGAQPRYGVIEVTTGSGVKKIYVRQGEEADYVMHPDDANHPRPYAKKFSPFNLSDPLRGTGGGHISEHKDILFGMTLNNRIFTDYPTQAGYFFQWNLGSGNFLKAFNPVNSIQAISGWETGSKGEWERMLDPCPPGYRHPNDSLRSPLTSEIRQSWYATPNGESYGPAYPSGVLLENSVWGFYADGFFDRLAVGVSPTGVESTTAGFESSSLYAVGNVDVAYSGLLIYNPATFSSLFLPAPGIREGNGALLNAGAMGAYWTNSPNGNNGWAFYFAPTSFYSYNNALQSAGASVRCVKIDFGLPGSI